MTIHASATFDIVAWDEKPYDEFEGGRKLSRARVKKAFHGDIEGASTVEYVMAYGADGSASFVGMERVAGRVGERNGSLVLQHRGTFAGGVAKSTYSIVPGLATGDLIGLQGEGESTVGHAPPYAITLDYDFDAGE